jgi:hypothetical protein
MSNTYSVYKICFLKQLSSYATISDVDLEKIASLDVDSSFDYEDGEYYYCYVITSELEIYKYKKILENNIIAYVCENISDNIIKNEYDISYIKDYIDEDNYFIYNIFLEDLDNWIYSHLDIDIILDIINSRGISSLREVDKRFLKENHEKG